MKSFVSFGLTSVFLLVATLTTTQAAVVDDTTPANNQANLSADAGQTFTVNIDTVTLNTVGSPLFGQKLSTIEIEGPQTTGGGDPLGPFTLEVWTDTDGDSSTWDPGALVATSTNSASLVAGGNTKTAYTFSDEKLTPGAVYAFTYTNGAGTRLPARVGLTNANDIPDGSVFSAGSIPFGDAFDTAMRITADESVVLDHVNLPSLDTNGANATFEYQTFTPSVAGLGTTDTVAANSPLTSAVELETVSFVRAPGGSATAGPLFIDIYTGSAGDAGTFVASSLNSIDINGAPLLSTLTWDFGDTMLSSADTYSLVFSTTSGAGGTAAGRVAAANNGGGFVDTYAGGFARGPDDFVVPFDTLFAATFVEVVPEPSSAVLGLIGVLGITVRRNRRLRGSSSHGRR